MPARLCAIVVLLACALSAWAEDDDLREAPPEARKPKSPLKWDRLMERNGIQPMVIPKTSRTAAEVTVEATKWGRSRFLDPEAERLKGTPQETELRAFLETAFQRWNNPPMDAIQPEVVAQAEAIINGPTRRPILDFLAANILETMKRTELAQKGFSLVAKAPAEPKFPSLLRVIAQAKVVYHRDANDIGRAESAQKLYDKVLAEHLAETPVDDVDASWIIFYHTTGAIKEVRVKRERRYLELYKASKLPEWARLTLAGEASNWLAWRKGGNGMGRPTGTAEEIAKYLEEAESALARAWELKRDSRYAPTMMLDVAKVRGASPETLRLWLDRAIAAQMDYTPAFGNYLNAIRPYWRGSHELLLAFGRACAETKRFDTDLPTRFNEAVFNVARGLDDWRSLYHHPEISALLLETREKCMAGIQDPFTKTLQAGHLIVEAWAAGDLERAGRALDALKLPTGKYFYPLAAKTVADKLGLDYFQVVQDVFNRQGEGREDYLKGVAAMAKKEYDTASKHFQEALRHAHFDARALLGANISLADFQKRYDAGEWAQIPAHMRMAWHQIDNQNVWDPEKKRLKLTGNWIFGRSLFRGNLGDRYEIRGHFRVSQATPLRAGLGIYCGVSPMFTGQSSAFWWTVRIDPRGSGKNSVDFAPKYDSSDGKSVKIDDQPDMPFVFRREGDKVSFFIGDREIIKGESIPEDSPSGERAWGLGVLGQGKGATSLVWGLEARRLNIKL